MLTVLVADDDADIRALVTFRLQQAGYQVIEATDGPSALASARAQRPDVAVLDGTMPGLSGTEVCRQFRADPELADLPVLLLSGHAAASAIEAGLGAGADDYLTKPFHARELVARVGALLRRADETQAGHSPALLASIAARAAFGSAPRARHDSAAIQDAV